MASWRNWPRSSWANVFCGGPADDVGRLGVPLPRLIVTHCFHSRFEARGGNVQPVSFAPRVLEHGAHLRGVGVGVSREAPLGKWEQRGRPS